MIVQGTTLVQYPALAVNVLTWQVLGPALLAPSPQYPPHRLVLILRPNHGSDDSILRLDVAQRTNHLRTIDIDHRTLHIASF